MLRSVSLHKSRQASVPMRRPPVKPIAAGVLILSICPGGGISTYYTYLARANVALSACITALSTVLSLLTMPLWLSLLASQSQAVAELKEVPVGFVFGQLVLFMVLPVAAGAAPTLRTARPAREDGMLMLARYRGSSPSENRHERLGAMGQKQRFSPVVRHLAAAKAAPT